MSPIVDVNAYIAFAEHGPGHLVSSIGEVYWAKVLASYMYIQAYTCYLNYAELKTCGVNYFETPITLRPVSFTLWSNPLTHSSYFLV